MVAGERYTVEQLEDIANSSRESTRVDADFESINTPEVEVAGNGVPTAPVRSTNITGEREKDQSSQLSVDKVPVKQQLGRVNAQSQAGNITSEEQHFNFGPGRTALQSQAAPNSGKSIHRVITRSNSASSGNGKTKSN